ncbi:MAG: hypothetical protein ACK2TT_00475 [Anaerolineales bacterium]
MYANGIQESKLRQAELIKEADHYRLVKSLRKDRSSRAKASRIIRSLAAQLSLS